MVQASSGRDRWLALLAAVALVVGATALAVEALGVVLVGSVPCAVDPEEEHPADARSSATTIASRGTFARPGAVPFRMLRVRWSMLPILRRVIIRRSVLVRPSCR
ncbi:hypothetical protein GCM10009838_22700 [Catenulispora subtropica]|uniref:Secreted protein n=1 Tax=Catenulispora subtropica TaxID=450798 RepID=A0ABN2R7D5_9ACTN